MSDDDIRLKEFAEQIVELAAKHPTAFVKVEIPSVQAVERFYNHEHCADELNNAHIVEHEMQFDPLVRSLILRTVLSYK